MAQASITRKEALEQIQFLVEDETPLDEIRDYLAGKGFTSSQISHLITSTVSDEKNKNSQEKVSMNVQRKPQTEMSPLEAFLSSILNLAIVYGVPMLIFVFGAAYVWGEMNRDLDVGVRSLAAALLPLTVTFAIRKSDLGLSASKLLSQNPIISFGFAFALAMVTAATAMYMRQLDNVIPIGELTFSATLSLMIFGTSSQNENISFSHIGAVCGFLSYIVLFGVAL